MLGVVTPTVPSRTHITVSSYDDKGNLVTKPVSVRQLYKGRTSEEVIKAEKWAKNTIKQVFG